MTDPTGDALRANAADPAPKMRELLERAWKYNEGRAAALDYELIIIAVPKFPANIEACSSVELETMVELLQTYIDAVKMKLSLS